MVLQREEPVRVWGWASNGEVVRVRIDDQEHTTRTVDNRWEVTLDPVAAGGPYSMVVDGFNRIEIEDIFFGEVWVASGQSNMKWRLDQTNHTDESLAEADFEKLRLFLTEEAYADLPQKDVPGVWAKADHNTAKAFSAVAFLFAQELRKSIGDVPIGIIQSTVGGTRVVNWTSEEILRKNPDAEEHYERYARLLEAYPAEVDAWRAGETDARPRPPHRRQPTGYFNAMIHGLMPYRIRGVIWYQGETDTWNAEQYTRMFPDMITDWRNRWGQGDFPFLYVQLPGLARDPRNNVNYPHLREIQRLIEDSLPDLAMAVTIDLGEKDDIHPQDKRQVAYRLGLLARKKIYGEKNLIVSGPVPEKVEYDKGQAYVLWGKIADGLRYRGDQLLGFEVAGEDGIFHPAEALLEGSSTILSSENVSKPVYVRYSFTGYPDGNLYNSEGLPAVPFRTDDFPRVVEQ